VYPAFIDLLRFLHSGAAQPPGHHKPAMHPPVASARVGRGASVMVSTTRVTYTGLPARLHSCKQQ
jgi:hypothetical protein